MLAGIPVFDNLIKYGFHDPSDSTSGWKRYPTERCRTSTVTKSVGSRRIHCTTHVETLFVLRLADCERCTSIWNSCSAHATCHGLNLL